MAHTKLLNSALAAAFVASVGFAAPAYALEAKQCLPMAEMNAALKAEGQRTMIIADRLALRDSTEIKNVKINRYANAVTSNADGSVGYQLEGDKPRAFASTNMCVAAKLTNIRLYDARKTELPQAAFLGGKFDDVVRENSTKGTRPMLVADSIHSVDGEFRTGLPVVMFGNIAGRSASLTTKLADGKPQFLFLMADPDYTPAALQRLGPTQVAMRSPD